jgi:hypothetical protein
VTIRRRRAAVRLLVLLAIVLLVSLLPTSGSPPASATPVGAGSLARPAASCPGSAGAPILTGTLGIDGSRTPRPTVANVTVAVDYRYQSTQTGTSGSTVTCKSGTLRTLTNSSDRFLLNLTLPGPSCGTGGCLTETGPFGPLAFHVTSGQAPGYLLRSQVNGSSVSLDWVDALATAATNPSQFDTVSIGAPTRIDAEAWDGAGLSSTANLTYGWTLVGPSWIESGPSNGSSITVQAGPTAGPGTVELWVNGSYNGTPTHLAPVHLYLTAAATTIGGVSFRPTALDVGVPATVILNATGAGGYPYSATLHPGLGSPSEAAACRVVPSSGGWASISCSFLVSYSSPGTAQPTANVTNGFSSQNWYFPAVEVSDALAVVVGPNPAESYPNVPIAVSIGVAARTGTGPFGPACFVTGDGRFLCDTAPGPNWTISVSFPAIGSFSAVVTVADRSGTNRTVPDPVAIVAHPSMPRLTLDRSAVVLNGSVVASATVTGGALPLSYWWNVTGPGIVSSLDSGVATTDTIPSVTFRSSSVGVERVLLTVVDALGTVEQNATSLTVLGGPAKSIVASAPLANGTVAAGSPVWIHVSAVDGFGDPTPGFSGILTLQVPSECGPVWTNASEVPVSGDGAGNFSVPRSAWLAGALNLSVAASRAGTCQVTLSGAPAIAAVVAVTIHVSVDPYHVSLVAPKTGAGHSATLYSIVDRFGNPQTSGFVDVRSVFAGVVNDVDSAIHPGPNGGLVWVNFSSTGPGSGTGYVISEYHESLLTVQIPAPAAATPWTEFAFVALAAFAVGAVAVGVAVVARRRRGGTAEGSEEPEDPDEPLRRLAEGRSHVLSRLSNDRDTDLDGVASGFPGRAPDAAELAEWVGTLVTEGLVQPSVGRDGRPRFRLAGPEPRRPGPRVEVDPMALDAALARRDLDAQEPPDGGGSVR